MRIAFVYDAVYPETKGGVERRVWELARRLVVAGCSVEILSPHQWDGPSVIEREGVVLRSVSQGATMYRKSGRRALLPSVRHALGVMAWLRRETYDVIDCQIPAHPAALAVWLVTRGQRRSSLVVTWHEAWGSYWIEEFGLLGYGGRAFEKLVAKIPATHLAVSSSVGSALAAIGRSPAEVIEAGVELSAVDRVEARVVSDVVCVGRLVPTKNVELLLKSIMALDREGQVVTVAVIGDGPLRAQLERTVDDMGLDDRVAFLGELAEWSDVIAVMKGSKVLALPSVREGYGLVVAEAAACGLPVVTVDHPRNAAQRLVDSDRTGLVTNPTVPAFSQAIGRILADDSLRERMASESRAWVGAGWDRTVDQTFAAYKEHGRAA